LISPRDEQVDIAPAQWETALQETQDSGNGTRGVTRTRNFRRNHLVRRYDMYVALGRILNHRGLLLLYLLDPESSGVDAIKDGKPVLAWAISFPGSNSGTKVPYEVNNVLWTQINGWDD
jgi:hypothetical protein